MPPHSSRPPPPHGPKAKHHRPGATPIPLPRPSSMQVAGTVTIGDVASLLTPLISEEEDRNYVARCIATEGPTHHRLASYALLKLLREALDKLGGLDSPPPSADAIPVALRLPPHLGRTGESDAHYPLSIPKRALDRLAPSGSREAAVFSSALTDGPPHHALANAAMVCFVDALLARLHDRDAE